MEKIDMNHAIRELFGVYQPDDEAKLAVIELNNSVDHLRAARDAISFVLKHMGETNRYFDDGARERSASWYDHIGTNIHMTEAAIVNGVEPLLIDGIKRKGHF